MANFRGHLTLSTGLGVAYGAGAVWIGQWGWGPALLGAGLVALGGLLPDLDSDSGILVRELFGLAGIAALILFLPRLQETGLPLEESLVILTGIYLLSRFGLATWFKYVTVHRGMFHSIPALLITGLIVYLLYHHKDGRLRTFLAGGIMVGFLSHLVLDEALGGLRGIRVGAGRYAGSALKWASPSFTATAFAYLVLVFLALLAWLSV